MPCLFNGGLLCLINKDSDIFLLNFLLGRPLLRTVKSSEVPVVWLAANACLNIHEFITFSTRLKEIFQLLHQLRINNLTHTHTHTHTQFACPPIRTCEHTLKHIKRDIKFYQKTKTCN